MSLKSRFTQWLLADDTQEYKSANAPIVTTGTNSLAGYTNKTTKNYSQFGYMANVTVYRSVMVLAQACASVEWQVFSKGVRRQELPDHPLSLLLNGPNTNQSRSAFITELVSYLVIAGTNYLYGSFPSASRVPFGLYNLRPDLVEPYPLDNKPQQSWRYNTGTDYIHYPLWQVKPIKFFHPLDPLHGLSPIQVAATVIERQNSGEEWNFSLLKNMARPSGAFVANTEFSDDARARLKAEIVKKYGRGAKTAGMPMLLENGLSYMQLGLSPVEADWLNSDSGAGRKIAAAIGVDPLLINDKQYSTYNNALEAKLALWELTGFPIMDLLRDDFNIYLVPFFDRTGGIEVAYNKRPIEALKRNRQLESVTTIAEYNNGVRSFNDTAEELGLDTVDESIDFYRFGPTLYVMKKDIKTWLKQNADQRVQAQILPPVARNTPMPATLPGTIATQVSPTLQRVVKPNVLQGNGAASDIPDYSQKDYAERLRYYHFVESERQQWYILVEESLKEYWYNEQEYLKTQAQEYTSYLQATAGLQAMQESHASLLYTLLSTYYASIASQAAKQLWQQFAVEKQTLKYETVDILTDSILTLSNRIRYDIQEGISSAVIDASKQYVTGTKTENIQREIESFYKRYSDKHASELATTIVVHAYNLGAYIAAMNIPMPLYKTWLYSAECYSHSVLDGQVLPLHTHYMVGDEQVAMPGMIPHCKCIEWYSQDLSIV